MRDMQRMHGMSMCWAILIRAHTNVILRSVCTVPPSNPPPPPALLLRLHPPPPPPKCAQTFPSFFQQLLEPLKSGRIIFQLREVMCLLLCLACTGQEWYFSALLQLHIWDVRQSVAPCPPHPTWAFVVQACMLGCA